MYILKDENEHKRLEAQNKQEQYSIQKELEHIKIDGTWSIIDAGCGAGDVTRELIRKGALDIIGIDSSKSRVMYYLSKFNDHNVKIVINDLSNTDLPENSYDLIVCRFVLHHQKDCLNILKEFYRILKPNGTVVIIDSDGILFNIYNEKYSFDSYFSEIKNLPLDLHIGRKIKSKLNSIGFRELDSKLIPMHFTGEALEQERAQYKERFNSMQDSLNELFGPVNAWNFMSDYLEALSDPNTELFYNKFIVSGKK